MHPILRNVLAVVAGIVVGSVVNMGLVMLFGQMIPPPEGVDPNDVESIKANMHLYQTKHFIGPFLAHAIGTLAGAYAAARLAISNNMKLALLIGLFFLLGGIMMVMSVGGPTGFVALDLLIAYLPMAYLGGKMASK